MPGALTALRRAFDVGRNYVARLPAADRLVLENFVVPQSDWHAWSLNNVLRSSAPSPDALERAAHIDSILRAAPRSEGPLELYRGAMMRERRGQLAPMANDPAYLSVSVDPDVATTYAEINNDMYEDMGQRFGRMVLKAPPKTPLVAPDIRDFFEDSELILPRGLSFKYTGKSKPPYNGKSPWYNVVIPEMPYASGGRVNECP